MTSKYGVVGLSESLYRELAEDKAKISVSVLCPYIIKTRIPDSARNRSADLQNELSDDGVTSKDKEHASNLRQSLQEQGVSPESAVEHVLMLSKKNNYISSLIRNLWKEYGFAWIIFFMSAIRQWKCNALKKTSALTNQTH